MRRILPSLLAAAVVLTGGGLFLFPRFQPGYAALLAPDQTSPSVALPANTVVLHTAEAKAVLAPFERRGDITTAIGQIVALPEGHGSTNRRGRVVLTFECPKTDRYQAWTRVRWRDSCGNSVALGVSNAPPYTAGQDAVYGVWHWVKAGTHILERGPASLTLSEREDGVEIDQILLTLDKTFTPTGSVGQREGTVDARQFGDDFARSPGHGLQHWTAVSGKWDINFTLDPNRIPNQYSLGATLGDNGKEALILADGPPWRGCSFGVSVSLTQPGCFGIVLDDATRVAINATGEHARLRVTGPDTDITRNIGDRVQVSQWHRLLVERWAWVLRVSIDGHPVLTECRLDPDMLRPGLFVAEGRVAFDDAALTEILWQAEDGKQFRIPWDVRDGAKWFRSKNASCRAALIGHAGVIATSLSGLPVREILMDGADCPGTASMPGFVEHAFGTGVRLLDVVPGSDAHDVCTAGFEAPRGKVRLRRVAIRYGEQTADVFRDGPYHFTHSRVPDPSDYLDFTHEEMRAIMQSPDVDKLKRGEKLIPLVGKPVTGSFWHPEEGRWIVTSGMLSGTGPGTLRYWKEIISDMDLRMKVKRADSNSTVAVLTYEGLGSALSVTLGERNAQQDHGELLARVPADDKWHDVHIRCRPQSQAVRVDENVWQHGTAARGLGGGILLQVEDGMVQFDDIEMTVPRHSDGGRVYAFDRVETDWWRKGQIWMDHGGFSCMLASSWMSLIAPDSRGTLWNKSTFSQDVAVSLMVQENSEWFGWKKNPSHVHYPYDNICVMLATEMDVTKGYRLELNARERKATVLYRNDIEVASVAQDASFPIRYVGGHGPYTPRSNQIALTKQRGKLTAVVNGECVMQYTDASPIPVQRIGVGGYHTRANFAHIQIREL